MLSAYRIAVPESPGGSYVVVVWPLAFCTTCGPLECYNEDFRLYKPHPMIIDNEGGVVRSHDILDVVRRRILFLLLPLFRAPPCTTQSMLQLAVNRTIGNKPGYTAFDWVLRSRQVIIKTGKLMARALRWACPHGVLTLTPLWKLKCESVSVDEANYLFRSFI